MGGTSGASASTRNGEMGCRDGKEGRRRNCSAEGGGGTGGAAARESFLFLFQNELFLDRDFLSDLGSASFSSFSSTPK